MAKTGAAVRTARRISLTASVRTKTQHNRRVRWISEVEVYLGDMPVARRTYAGKVSAAYALADLRRTALGWEQLQPGWDFARAAGAVGTAGAQG